MSLLGAECVRCHKLTRPPLVTGLCECGGPRVARYDIDALRGRDLRRVFESRAPALLARWIELMPFANAELLERVSMGETETPLLGSGSLGRHVGMEALGLKLDLVLPSASLKDRPHSAIVAAALERDAKVISVNSSGNAATALASHANRVGIETIVAIPLGSSQVKVDKARALGAHVVQLAGSVDQCANVMRVLAAKGGWFAAESWVNPYMVEGTKTIGFEIASQMKWDPPDVLVLPLGNGAATVGPWKALDELHQLGIVERVPRIVGVQWAHCAPLVKAFESGATEPEPVIARPTLTTTLMVSNPSVSGPYILEVLRKSGGLATAVSDDEVREAMRLLAQHCGVLAEPAGAISLAGALKLARTGAIGRDERVVALVSGAGANQPDRMEMLSPPPVTLTAGQEHELDPASLLAN
jgi:threonine synthase